MSVNTMKVSGRIKNIKAYTNARGTLITGHMTQKNGAERATFTIPIVATEPEAVMLLQALATYELDDKGFYDAEVEVGGLLSTQFDVRPQNAVVGERFAPRTRIDVRELNVI